MSVARVMPEQKPGRSVQEVGTPREFLDAVEALLGRFVLDLAANESNHVVPRWFGPGGEHHDSLAAPWLKTGLLWLNPPFADIRPWAAKCASESRDGARIAMLIPAAVGTNYWAEHIDRKAMVLFLSPRLTFVGHTQSYPKDLALCWYGPGMQPGYQCWRWKQ